MKNTSNGHEITLGDQDRIQIEILHACKKFHPPKSDKYGFCIGSIECAATFAGRAGGRERLQHRLLHECAGYVWVGLYLFPSLHPPSLDPQSRPKTGYQGKGDIRMEKK
jgi:hypothetical protein